MMYKGLWMFVDYFILSSLWLPFAFARSLFEYEIRTPSLFGHSEAEAATKEEQTSKQDGWNRWINDVSAEGDEETTLASRSVRTAEYSHSQRLPMPPPEFPTDYHYNQEEGDDPSPTSFANDTSHLESMDVTESFHEEFRHHSPLLPYEEQEEEERTPPELLEQSQELSNVVYRYYGRTRIRLRAGDSVPFICLGPSVDHWKDAAQSLASRGFSVMACELPHSTEDLDIQEEGRNLILAVLKALRWQRAIIVGCGEETILAMSAALQLAPEQVAGVVFCGDLSSLQSLSEGRSVDQFLEEYLDCPFQVIWDGDEELVDLRYRSLILGGGSNPHRRMPEQFAWSLSRFVEETVVPSTLVEAPEPSSDSNNSNPFKFSWPAGLKELINPGSVLVAGRVIAQVIFYVSAFEVLVHQYENFHEGMLRFRSGYAIVMSWPKKVLRLVTRILTVGLLNRAKSGALGPANSTVIQEGVDTSRNDNDEQNVQDGNLIVGNIENMSKDSENSADKSVESSDAAESPSPVSAEDGSDTMEDVSTDLLPGEVSEQTQEPEYFRFPFLESSVV